MRQALAVALQDYEGAVVLVSHDRHLLKVNSDKLMLVANGRATEFKGSVDDYPKWLSEHNRGAVVTEFVTKNDDAPAQNTASAKKQQKRLDAERRKQLQPLTSKIKRCERVMDKLGMQRKEIENKLADTELYSDENRDTLKKLLTDQAYLQKEMDQAEADWLEATQMHEELSISMQTD